MNNEKLARFIVSLGSFNNYTGTVNQTKEALDTLSLRSLRSDNEDRVLFLDNLRAVNEVKGKSLTVDNILDINRCFSGDSKEQPKTPGLLRNGELRVEDNIYVSLWLDDFGNPVRYYPKKVVTYEDLNIIVSDWNNSEHTERDAWELFARLAKLQPFQDGNKRTALIAANLALGTLESQMYLLVPTGRAYLRFIDNLLGYYGVGLSGGLEDEQLALNNFLGSVGVG